MSSYRHCLTWANIVTLLLIYLNCALTRDVRPQKEFYTPNYQNYHNTSTIGLTLDKFVSQNPSFIKYYPEYVSRQKRSQNVVRITNYKTMNKNDISIKDRVNILFSFGEHAREFLPIESFFYLLKKLIDSQEANVNHHPDLDLNKLDIYVIVLGNPDGRQYVETTKNYCWRGTSTGVDMNRNFDWEFGGKGSSPSQKDEEYRGAHAFSEPECKVYTDLTEKIQFDAFLSLHSGIRQIYIPYADTKSRQTGREPENLEKMMELAKLLATSTKHTYQYGKAASLNEYTADGTAFDYMAGVRKIPFSYAIELWGPDHYKGSSCFNMFNPLSGNVMAVVEEIYPLYTTFLDYMIKWKEQSSGAMSNISNIENTYKPLEVASQVNNRLAHQLIHISNQSGVKHSDTTETVHSLPSMAGAKQADVPSLTPGLILLCIVVMVTLVVGIHGKCPISRRMYQRRRVVSLRALGSSFSTNFFTTYRT